jgi:outer membrane protein assembly factor BamB
VKLLLTAFFVIGVAALSRAQTVNPVYVDDSPVARETLLRIDEFEASGNEGEAVRELQRLLDDQPDRLVAEPGQNNLFVSVRARVHRKLLASPKLLERYRNAETARARKELEANQPELVERSRLLTGPGFEAALRVAQAHLEAAEFEAARATLEQLRTHPDRSGSELNKDAAQLAAVVARYINRTEVWTLADDWARQAGVPAPAHQAVQPPASLRQPRSDFMSPSPALDHEDVPVRPLWSTSIDPPGVMRDRPFNDPTPEENLQHLYILPTVVGDCVYVNDSTYISARDRFTLQPRWTLKPVITSEEDDAMARRAQAGRAGARSEDTSTVTIHGRVLVATTGLVQAGMRADAGRTYALDTATGAVLWSFLLPELDQSLEGAAVRGPAIIDGSTIVLVARKSAQQRRIVALYLVGVSLDNGSLKWIRPIGSAGALQFRGVETRMEHAATLSQGIVYCVDRLGVMAGVEAATGRPLWIRRWPVVTQGPQGFGMPMEVARPWQWDSPIVRDGSMLTLSPDRSELVSLDRVSGAIQSRRPAAALGGPAYLLNLESSIAAVSGDAVYFVPASDPGEGKVTTTRTFASPGIRGRVTVSGGKVIVPRSDGVAVIDPAKPQTDEAVIRLDRIGNVLPLENQLLVIDPTSLHSFVTWAVAQRILDDRMRANPADPDPAITFAELAYRSQHPDQIVPAIDKAVLALDKIPTSETGRQARVRLFDVIREVVENSQAGWAPPEPTPAAVVITPPVRRRDQPRPAPPKPDMPVLDPAQLAPIVERWGRIADSPGERAVQLLSLGRLREAQNQPALAAEAYQRILSDRLLSNATWKRAGVSVRAELEAARRTRQLVLDHGAAIYAAFEAQAAHELSTLGPGATAEDLERLARQYPGAAASATMWLRSADLHEGAGRPHATIAALREGLSAAEAVRAAGVAIEDSVTGELGGRLVRRLQALDQIFAAAQLITRLRAQYPDLVLIDRGETVNAQSLASGLTQRLAALKRLPRIGSDILPTTQPLAGWVIMQPRSKEQTGRVCEHIVLVAPGESRIALWGVSGGGGDGARAGTPLQELWSRPYTGSPPLLYRVDPESVWLLWDRNPAGASLERIGTIDGQTIWKTEPFRSLFDEDQALEQRIQFARNIIETPMDGAVKLTDIAVTMDEQVVAIVEHSGRIACFDPGTGNLLWRGPSPVQQVHDADVGGGALVLGGQSPLPIGGGGMDNLVAVLDARTGRLMHKLDQLVGKVRWVRVAGAKIPAEKTRPACIAGLDSEVACFDLEGGKANWTIPGGPAFESREAWVFGDRLFLLDENRSLWLAAISSPKLVERQLETYEHLVGTGSIQGFASGPEFLHTGFATDRGVCIFDEAGRLIGIDALEGGEAEEGALLPPIPTADGFITVETVGVEGPGGRPLYNIHFLDNRSAMLRGSRKLSLELQPRRMAVLDGKILVTAGTNTIVYSAPEVDE